MKIKKVLYIILNIIFVFLFIWAIFKADLNVFIENFNSIGLSGLFLLLFLFLISYLVKAFRFKYVNEDLSFRNIFITTIYQNFFIFLLPFRLGELTYIKKLKEHNIHWKKSTKDLIFIRLNDILVLSIFACIIFLFVNNSFSKYLSYSFLIIPIAIIGIYISDRFSTLEKIKFRTKIQVFFFSIVVWFFSFLPWVYLLSKFLDLDFFKITFVIGIVLISTLFPINPPAGIGLINGVWSLALILVGIEKDIALNFGIFAYSIFLFQIVFIFLFVRFTEIYCFHKNKL